MYGFSYIGSKALIYSFDIAFDSDCWVFKERILLVKMVWNGKWYQIPLVIYVLSQTHATQWHWM